MRPSFLINRGIYKFLEGKSINIIDLIEKGKIPPWNLHPSQVEKAVERVYHTWKRLPDDKKAEYLGRVTPRFIWVQAKQIKAKNYMMAKGIIDDLRRQISFLKIQRVIFIALGIMGMCAMYFWGN